jgi:hypothetical protein
MDRIEIKLLIGEKSISPTPAYGNYIRRVLPRLDW